MRNIKALFFLSICIIFLINAGCTEITSKKNYQAGNSQKVMITVPHEQGDLDFDGDVDDADIKLFESVLGENEYGNNFNEPADADHDGTITLKDKRILFPNLFDDEKKEN